MNGKSDNDDGDDNDEIDSRRKKIPIGTKFAYFSN